MDSSSLTLNMESVIKQLRVHSNEDGEEVDLIMVSSKNHIQNLNRTKSVSNMWGESYRSMTQHGLVNWIQEQSTAGSGQSSKSREARVHTIYRGSSRREIDTNLASYSHDPSREFPRVELKMDRDLVYVWFIKHEVGIFRIAKFSDRDNPQALAQLITCRAAQRAECLNQLELRRTVRFMNKPSSTLCL